MKQIFIFVLIAFFVVPQLADAAVIVRSGDSISLEENQVAEGDLYTAGGSVAISGIVNGDLFAAGGTLTLNGTVAEDAVLVGDTIQVHGRVQDDMRLAGRDIVIAETIKGDVVAFGDTLRVLSTAVIEGDVVFFGRVLEMSGEIDGSLTGNTDTVRIDGFVGGDVSMRSAQPLTLGERANVEGNVVYTSSKELVRAQGSVVVGDVERKNPVRSDSSLFGGTVLSLFILLFTSLVYFFLFKDQLEILVRHVQGSYGKQGLVGLGTLVLTPIAAVVLMITLVGFGIGLLLMLVYGVFVILAWSLGGIFTGVLLAKLIKKRYIMNWTWVLIGTAAFYIIGLIPFIGWLLTLLIMLTLLGGIVTLIYNRLK